MMIIRRPSMSVGTLLRQKKTFFQILAEDAGLDHLIVYWRSSK